MIPTEKQQAFDQFTMLTMQSKSKDLMNLLHYIQHPNSEIPIFNTQFTQNTYLFYALFRLPQHWGTFEEHLLLFLRKSIWSKPNRDPLCEPYLFIRQVAMSNYRMYSSDAMYKYWIEILIKYGIAESDIWLAVHDESQLNTMEWLGNYVNNNAVKFLPILPFNFCNSSFFINHIIENNPKLIDKYLDKFMTGLCNGKKAIARMDSPIMYYFNANPKKYETYLVSLLTYQNNDFDSIFNLIDLINRNYLSKYSSEISVCLKAHIHLIINNLNQIHPTNFGKFLDLLLAYDSSENAIKGSGNYLSKFKNCNPESIKIWLKKLKQYETAMTSDIIENLWLFARHADKEVRQLTAQHIAKTLGEAAIPEAEKMIVEKKTDVRLTGARILSLIKTEKATNILRGYMDDEINDEVRNAMLEGIAHYLVENASTESVAEAVESAKKRGKLSKPILAWLANPPQLTYKKDGITLDSDTIAFLLYRMSQAKDIRTDLEARPLLSLIDRETSAPFAKWLLDSYFQNGADAKLKWCLTLGAMLGGDNEVSFLQRNVVSFVDSNRGKMGENVVKALALQGSQRALRAVEFFSRKYKTKNKNIGAAALEAFDVAAEELGMTPYELADSVIPDFGFDGLFKEFEANKETYRAFIGNDFKLAFLDEDNKTLKALPKGTSAELKEEFKEIGKEIRDIVKSQSSRLEQYLVIQRRWSVDKWQAFFLTNPVMFVYAVRLIWGVFDEKNQLITVFRCQEDQTLTDKNGDELDFGGGMSDVGSTSDISNPTSQIGMVHPIGLDAETTDFWKNDLLDNGIEAIFPQLTRPVILLKDIDKNTKMSDEFAGVQFGGYGFISRMDKTGWSRGSVVDAGGISSYYKEFTEVGLVAIVMQTGYLSVGYYDVNAEIGNLMFVKKSGVRFGSYQYDEPSKHDDPRLVRFGDVPPIVYSEVMADMLFFKENQVKEA